MESFLLLLVGIKDYISDFFHYFLEEVLTDRRKVVRLILGILFLILVILGIRAVMSHSRKTAEEALDPEAQMVLPISPPVTQAPELSPLLAGTAGESPSSTGSSGVSSSVTTNGGVSMSNGYLDKKSGGVKPFVTSTKSGAAVQSTQPEAEEGISIADSPEDTQETTTQES